MELTITAETTGPFIEVSENTLDFAECVFDSVYQLSFVVYNKASIPHGIGIKFPKCLKKYLSANENDVCIPAGGSKKLTIRFIPRKKIIDKDELSYYEPSTKILEFPIYVSVTSKNFSDVPPTKVKVFAILTEAGGLSLQPSPDEKCSWFYKKYHLNKKEDCDEVNMEYCLDLGKCTIAETVSVELVLQNTSFVSQNYGFFNLPECIKILPNYGFGEIQPQQVRRLTLTFSPEVKDIPNYLLEGEMANHSVTAPITVSSLKDLGKIGPIQKPFSYRLIRKSLTITEKELQRLFNTQLLEDITDCLNALKNNDMLQLFNWCDVQNSKESLLCNFIDYTNLSVKEEEEASLQNQQCINAISNTIWMRATIVNPLCELSHQYIEFPDTPCGSYSVMNITLRALNNIDNLECFCGYAEKYSTCKDHINYLVQFEITSNNEQITIDQSCGRLINGQEITLYLVARPQLPHEIIINTAKELKKEQLLQQKILDWESKHQKHSVAKMSKSKLKDVKKKKSDTKKKSTKASPKNKPKSKGSKSSGSKSPSRDQIPKIPEFTVEDHEIILDDYDMYPAEMVIWKNMKPYYIEAKFCCTLTYYINETDRKIERLYFTTFCNVVQPHFVIDSKTQHINFGCVTVGTSQRKILRIQNIQDKEIRPTMTLLSPTGYFICSLMDTVLPPQHILQMPLTFTPLEASEAIEYLEIKAGNTICPLIISGTGVSCNLVIKPDFVVCRLEAKNGGCADCIIELINQGNQNVIIEFVKVCELEGEIKSLKKESTIKANKHKTKNKSPKKNSRKGSPSKKNKFSQELTNEEIESIEKYFTHKQGESYFEVLGSIDNKIDVPTLSKKTAKIQFGVPVRPESSQSKKGKKENKSKRPVKSPTPHIHYVAKFNIMLGRTFLKDAIIIGSFV